MRTAGIAILVSLATATSPAFCQDQRTGPLSPALQAHLQAERFQIITSMRGLPLGVREKLQQMWGTTTLDIAEPGGDFQRMQALVGTPLPLRRLVAAGCAADNHCLVYYERGGASVSQRVTLFKWAPATTTFEWGATAPAGLKSIDAVRIAIASGKVTGGASSPW